MMDCAACNMYFLILFEVSTFVGEKFINRLLMLHSATTLFYLLPYVLLIQVRLPAAGVQCFKLQEQQDKASQAMHC